MRTASPIAVAALIMAASASAENNSVIKYTLQLGGQRRGWADGAVRHDERGGGW